MYYYGMKLHMVGQRRGGNLTFSGNDNSDTGFGQRPDRIQKRMRAIPIRKTVLADKIYSDFSFFNESNPVKVLTPHKEIKGEPEVLKQREKAARDLFSQAVSKSQTTYRILFQLAE